MVAGGSEAAINEAGMGGFNSMQAISTKTDETSAIGSRPFDVNRDGFVMGEGGGALILEEYEHAVQRNAHIYAECAGGGMWAECLPISRHPIPTVLVQSSLWGAHSKTQG